MGSSAPLPLHLRPEGSRVRYFLSGWLMSCAIEVEMREIALLFDSMRLGVGKPSFLSAVLTAGGAVQLDGLNDSLIQK